MNTGGVVRMRVLLSMGIGLMVLLLPLLTACNLTVSTAGEPTADVGQMVRQTFAALTQAAGGPAIGPTVDPNTAVDEAVQQTLAAQTQMAQAVAQTVAAAASSTPEFTLTPTFTLTPAGVHVSVSVETNCRSGPGPAYEKLGVLRVGQTAEVVGRNSINDTWIIKLPSNPAVTCWLWGQYGTVTGEWQALPVLTPPPTPTAAAAFVVDYSDTKACASPVYWFLNFKITNTGSFTWESLWITLTDQNTTETRQMAFNDFTLWGVCSVISYDANLDPGEVGYTGYALTANPAGHTVIATIKLCTQNDFTGTCLEKTLNVTP